MTTITFDTLLYANKLKAAGVPDKQAEAQAEAIAEIIEERVATKQDLKELELRADVKFAEVKADIIKWVIGVSAAQAAFILSIVKFLH